MFAVTFPSHTTVREERERLEHPQVMSLVFTLTHTAHGGWQGWILGFSRAVLDSLAYNSLQFIVIFRTEGQIGVIYRKPFLLMEDFPSRKVSNAATNSVLLFQCSCTNSSGTVGSPFLSLVTQVLRRVLQDPLVNVAIQTHATANCNQVISVGTSSEHLVWALALQSCPDLSRRENREMKIRQNVD